MTKTARLSVFLITALAVGLTGVAKTKADIRNDSQLRKNKELVSGFFQDVFAKKDAEAAARYLRPDYIQHNLQVPTGLAGFQEFFREQFKKSPTDLKLEVLDTVAEGDRVV